MGNTLYDIALSLAASKNTVQLIYAFNGVGKTRLSGEFKELIDPKYIGDIGFHEPDESLKILYYNAFTEDLFYWDNDLDGDVNRKIIIRPNGFTNLALGFLRDQGQDGNIASNFQRYTNPFITPRFSEDYSEATFSLDRGGNDSIANIKISKGEESNFIWCVFYSLLEQIVNVLNIPEPDERETNQFDKLKFVFIDDPVSSLDDNHLIELAVNIAQLIKSSQSNLKFIITTHNPLFYNVLFNEFNRETGTVKKRLEKLDDGTYLLEDCKDSPFSYHLFLLSELDKAIVSGTIHKYHFNFLRNILEKSATFLGYDNWEELLSDDAEGAREGYYKRIINFSSHSKFSGEEIPILLESEKAMLARIVNDFKTNFGFKSKA